MGRESWKLYRNSHLADIFLLFFEWLWRIVVGTAWQEGLGLTGVESIPVFYSLKWKVSQPTITRLGIRVECFLNRV